MLHYTIMVETRGRLEKVWGPRPDKESALAALDDFAAAVEGRVYSALTLAVLRVEGPKRPPAAPAVDRPATPGNDSP